MLPIIYFFRGDFFHWTVNWYALPCVSSVSYGSMCGVEVSWTFPIHFGIFIIVTLVQLMSGQLY